MIKTDNRQNRMYIVVRGVNGVNIQRNEHCERCEKSQWLRYVMNAIS
jgi:hypothetical protein